jgi:membrane-associated phospholipid phosphatase
MNRRIGGMHLERGPIIAWSVGIISFAVISFFYLDIPIAYHFKADRSYVRGFAGFITKFGYGTWYFVGLSLLLVYFGYLNKKPRYFYSTLFIVVAAASAGVLNALLKFVCGRYRPDALFSSSLYGFNLFSFEYAKTSFPSGHACFITSLMLSLWLLFPRFGFLFMPFAMIVALSRVVTCVHYMSDVLFGSLLGFLITLQVKRRFSKLEGINRG